MRKKMDTFFKKSDVNKASKAVLTFTQWEELSSSLLKQQQPSPRQEDYGDTCANTVSRKSERKSDSLAEH